MVVSKGVVAGNQEKHNQKKDLPLTLTKWPDQLDDDDADNTQVPSHHHHLKVELSDELKENIERIGTMLRSMGDGEISVSPYDTAWVAPVEDIHDTSGKPQFPTSIQWIVDNQLEDGSWGEENIFEAHDRIINTLGCVIALKSWNIYPEKCEKVPGVYPVDLFEHIWVVDRLQRHGISRYFKDELKDCVEYVHKHWTEHGICWARDSEVQDIDDTAVGFRILRLHSYTISPDVFKYFKKDGEFFCFAGQSSQVVTGMYNLYRASQLQYPDEDILEEARNFSSTFLRQKQTCNQLDDRWIIQRDLPGEYMEAQNSNCKDQSKNEPF